MKRIISLSLMALVSFNVFSQRYPFHYEMSIQEPETGHYFIEYSKNKKTDTVGVKLHITDYYGHNINRDLFTTDTVIVMLQITDYYGNNIQRDVCINDSIMRTDKYGFLPIVLLYKETLNIRIENATMTRNAGFRKSLHFWNWNEEQVPSKIVVALGLNSQSIIHIESDIKLKNDDFQEIKNKILGKKYDDKIFEHLRIRRVVYF